MSQKHESVTLGSVQGEAEGALEPPHPGERDRDRGTWERGRAVTARRKAEGIKDCFRKMLEEKETALRVHSLSRGRPEALLCVVYDDGDDEDDNRHSTLSPVLQGHVVHELLEIRTLVLVDLCQRIAMINDLKIDYICSS